MHELNHLFENNRRWVAHMTATDPEFFQKLSRQQKPQYLWIGCADSRVPANEIVGLLPGELFVHRNVSNVVSLDDPNCLSVIQFAVDVLGVRHIIVCGHFGCGGVEAALHNRRLGLSDHWLKYVRNIRDKYWSELSGLEGGVQFNRLCQLNVIEQVLNVSRTSIVRNAWSRQQRITIHGWIYAIGDGLLRDIGISISCPEDVTPQYEAALKKKASDSPQRQAIDEQGLQRI
jgi:carbonic anhydrase